MGTRTWLGLLVGASLGLLGACAQPVAPPEGWVGTWEGRCELIVTWAPVEEVWVRYEIHDDGRVGGFLGDATVTHGQLLSNDPISLALGNASHLVTADLSGALHDENGFTRESFVATLREGEGETLTTGITTNYYLPGTSDPADWDEWKCRADEMIRVETE